MPETKYIKIIHPTPEDIAKADEFLQLVSMREPGIGPMFAEIRDLIAKYPENELFYWKMATFLAFRFYRKSEDQLQKVAMGQPTSNPSMPEPPKSYPSTTFPPRRQ